MLLHGGKFATFKIPLQLIQTSAVTQNPGIPSFPAAAVTHRKVESGHFP